MSRQAAAIRLAGLWLFLVGLWAGRSQAIEPAQSLDEICALNSRPRGFTSLDQVRSVLDGHNRLEGAACSAEFNEAFEELGKLVADGRIVGDICGREAYGAIRRFHQRFISAYTPEAARPELLLARNQRLKPIPPSLAQFFILFALQASAQCKRELVARLEGDLGGLVSDEEFEVMRNARREAARLFGHEYRERTTKFDKLVLPVDDDLLATAADQGEDEDGKLYFKVRFGDVLKRMQDLCEFKFRPIYEELFRPVIWLANLGYSDRTNTKHERELLNHNKNFTRWLSIIEHCQVFKYIEVIHDDSLESALVDTIRLASPISNANGGARKVDLLSREEAEALKGRIERAKLDRRGASLRAFKVERPEVGHKKVPFTARMWLTEERQRANEVKMFYKKLRTLEEEKTSAFRVKRRELALYLKKKFYRHKMEFVERDESATFGKLAAFCHRHRIALQALFTVLGLVILVAHLGG